MPELTWTLIYPITGLGKFLGAIIALIGLALSPYPFLGQGPIVPSAYRATSKTTPQHASRSSPLSQRFLSPSSRLLATPSTMLP